MECSSCLFKEEVEKLKNYNYDAVEHVCDICGNKDYEDSIVNILFNRDCVPLKNFVQELYSSLRNLDMVADLMNLPRKVVENILEN